MVGRLRTDSSSCRDQNAGGAAQIVGAAGQDRLHLIPDQAEEAHAAKAVVFFEHGERPFNRRPLACDQAVTALVPLRQLGVMLVGPAHQAVLVPPPHPARCARRPLPAGERWSKRPGLCDSPTAARGESPILGGAEEFQWPRNTSRSSWEAGRPSATCPCAPARPAPTRWRL